MRVSLYPGTHHQKGRGRMLWWKEALEDPNRSGLAGQGMANSQLERGQNSLEGGEGRERREFVATGLECSVEPNSVCTQIPAHPGASGGQVLKAAASQTTGIWGEGWPQNRGSQNRTPG